MKSHGLTALLLMFLGAGCSSFPRDWARAAARTAVPNDLSGRWQGQWLSQVNGHHGDLKCLITKVDEAHYDARFRAEYKKWLTLHFSYTVRLEATASTNGWSFHGAEDLGFLAGGTYRYLGEAGLTNFQSTYSSKYDHGLFQMTRPVP